MSLALLTALAVSSTAAAPTLPACSWDRPGVNPFMGDVVAAVDRYADIPAEVRSKLKKRMAARQYDEIASIKRDSIEGKHSYSNLRDMHFGQGQVCQTVTRSRWGDKLEERGLVYCEEGHCLIVPTVCRNVSRVTRTPRQASHGSGHVAAVTPPADELLFEAPAAGPLASDSPGSDPRAMPAPISGPAFAGGDPGHGGGVSFASVAAPGWTGFGGGGSYGGGGGGGGGDSDDPRSNPPREVPGIQSGPKPALPPGGPDPFGPPGTLAPIPEPSSWALMALGLLGTIAAARRRRSARSA